MANVTFCVAGIKKMKVKWLWYNMRMN